MRRSIPLIAAGLGVVLATSFFAIGAAWLWFNNWGVITLLNSTQEPISSGYVLVRGERTAVGPMRPGDMQRVFFKVRGTTAARAVLRMASGPVVCGDGQLKGVLIIDDTIGVVPEGVYFSTPANMRTGTPCLSGGLPRE